MNLLYLQQAFTILLSKFIKFGLVGFSGVFVDFSITWLLKERFRVQQYASNAAGFMTAASTNYVLNRIWTFQSTNPNVAFEYGEFILISIIGLAINTTILWLLVSRLKLNFYVSKIIAIAIVTLWNFAANLAFTFNGV